MNTGVSAIIRSPAPTSKRKCGFNFKTEDEALFKELEDLTARGFTAFKKAGYI